ncbi:bleomycin resistance protein [Bradyrhizobium sp. HKCCYLRH3061]|uniref:bleomycin resistance protein n=1 Tax=Bradyrhizobium TaxID=374 RepID=UPI003EBD7698
MTVSDTIPSGGFAALVPELDVTDLDASRRFWCDVLGFRIAYQRPENRFLYLEMQGAQVMLTQYNGNWQTGELERPFGRGLNFQIIVEDVSPMLDRLARANWPLFQPCRDAWYQVGEQARGQRQFLVQDPDGYLLRFAQDLGMR